MSSVLSFRPDHKHGGTHPDQMSQCAGILKSSDRAVPIRAQSLQPPLATLQDCSTAAALRRVLCLCFLWCWWIAVLSPCAGQANPAPTNVSELRQHLGNLIAQPRFAHARWGVCIVSLDTGATLFSHDEHKLFIPASNTKLFTGALALDRFGGDFQIRTSIYAANMPGKDGVLKGDLIVYGRGDPSFATRWHNNDLDTAFNSFAEICARARIGEIQGDIVADESFFVGPRLGSGWEWDDLQYYYGAEVSALSVNDNAVEVAVHPADAPGSPLNVTITPPLPFVTVENRGTTVIPGQPANILVTRPLMSDCIHIEGSLPANHTGYVERVSVHRPARWFGQCVKKALESRGVRVDGGVRVVDATMRRSAKLDPDSFHEIGFVFSPPMREVVKRMMKSSQNLHAQLLLLQVGAADTDHATAADRQSPPNEASIKSAVTPPAKASPRIESTETAGVKALERFLEKAGIPVDEVHVIEGAGLSRHNLITPAATVALLRYMDKHPASADFRESLPIAGVDGTLRNRMKGTPAAGNARAKTGSLSRVDALSGYVTTAAGERLAFSLMINNYSPGLSDRSARAELDEIVALLAGLQQFSNQGQ
ncbi:MAG: D-alanyl-D-alanine carboxypeptidase/D-alanyl-D-alanine-endopeptidase [Verrucomicrobiota bacterium]|nr:D-alanyl-D-alanine carboxypeptidase/D-alanyl-D-alanine-endopeptidase [Verrucomicrobiota bacterium]